MSDDEYDTFSFGILDGVSRGNSYMQAVDKFRISEYSNAELSSWWLSHAGNGVWSGSRHNSIKLAKEFNDSYLYKGNISHKL